MKKKRQLIETAAELCSLGEKAEKKREQLRKLIEHGYTYESPEIIAAFREFQLADEEWKQLETKYLTLRAEVTSE